MNNEQMSEKRYMVHVLLQETLASDPERLKLILKIYDAYVRGDEKTKAAILAELQK